MTSAMDSFYAWAGAVHPAGAHEYFRRVAAARYVIRKVFRIIDERARKSGLEPLNHQALLQVFGGPEDGLRVNELAERLDIPAALASRLVKELEVAGYVTRVPSSEDRRVKRVRPTDSGRELLSAIDDDVHFHMDYFQRGLSDADRADALRVFAFYAGAPMPREPGPRRRQVTPER